MPNINSISGLALVSLLLLGSPSRAETLTAEAKELLMTPGFAIILQLPRNYKTAVVGDPNIADITPQSDNALTINAKKLGTTNLIVLDANGREVYSANVIVGARELGRVNVHSSRDLHAYTPYQCTPASCARVRDELAVGRPVREVGPAISIQNVTGDNVTPQGAPSSVSPQ